MRTFTPLWSMIVGSSLWAEPDVVIKVFLTMLAKKDFDHIYRGTAFELAHQSRKTEVEVLEALKVLSLPDRNRIEKQDFEGRRIKAVDEGWLILNGEKYQEMMRDEMRRFRVRKAQAEWRKRQKAKALENGKPLKGEQEYERAVREGASEERLNSIVEKNLPT